MHVRIADIAKQAPPLANGLTALDVVRQTLDRYLSGVRGFAVPGYRGVDGTQPPSVRPPFLDCYPSLLIAAMDYVQGSGDTAWARRNYQGLKAWAEMMLAMDRDGKGLLDYPGSGNADPLRRPNDNVSNWWDDIGFGHEDAYANALAYRCCAKQRPLPARSANKRMRADSAPPKSSARPTTRPSTTRPPASSQDGALPTDSVTTIGFFG